MILLTGGTGYIGSHTCIELLEQGYEVVLLDNLANSSTDVLDGIYKITGKKVQFYQKDVLDTKALIQIFNTHEIDSVIHFAGLKAVGESVEKPLDYYENNVGGTLSLLDAMKACNVKKIVFSSSATVYGEQSIPPYTEEMGTFQSTSPYGQTKVMIEEILKDISMAADDFAVCMLRYFNPIGAHPSGHIGENPEGIPNNLMPYITQVAAKKLAKLSVYGKDYDTEDGSAVRDYIHIQDIAKGHIAAMEALQNAGLHIYNLGTGKGTSVLELLETFQRATGVEVPYEIVERRAGDLPVAYADASKAQKDLGWVAEKSLEDMCNDAWNYQRKRI